MELHINDFVKKKQIDFIQATSFISFFVDETRIVDNISVTIVCAFIILNWGHQCLMIILQKLKSDDVILDPLTKMIMDALIMNWKLDEMAIVLNYNAIGLMGYQPFQAQRTWSLNKLKNNLSCLKFVNIVVHIYSKCMPKP